MSRKIRVMVVDDDAVLRKLLADQIARMGFDSTPAASGEEALDALSKSDFDVVLLDIRMPGLSGLEAVFGMAHGLGWIAMSLACITALRLRVIDLRLAVAVAVLGGIGPFIGSMEFVRAGRRGFRGHQATSVVTSPSPAP